MHASSNTVKIEAWSESQMLTLNMHPNTSQGSKPCIWVGALLATGFAVLCPSSSFYLHALDSFFRFGMQRTPITSGIWVLMSGQTWQTPLLLEP